MTTAVAVRERPILFSGPMVRAILEGRKTQTRRVAKISTAPDMYANAERDPVGRWVLRSVVPHGQDYTLGNCPYGNVGDRLWVREAFWDHGDMGGLVTKLEERVEYRATEWDRKNPDDAGGWKPSIHMPRWASRLTLEITEVRVERIQECTFGDARDEGVVFDGGWWQGSEHPVKGTPKVFNSPVLAFADRWNALNGKRGFGWEANPWVWVIGFRRVLSEQGPKE